MSYEVSKLPARANLENLRKQARSLLRQLRAKDPSALESAAALYPHAERKIEGPGRWALSDAQWMVARRYGFASWPRLVEDLERRRDDTGTHGERPGLLLLRPPIVVFPNTELTTHSVGAPAPVLETGPLSFCAHLSNGALEAVSAAGRPIFGVVAEVVEVLRGPRVRLRAHERARMIRLCERDGCLRADVQVMHDGWEKADDDAELVARLRTSVLRAARGSEDASEAMVRDAFDQSSSLSERIALGAQLCDFGTRLALLEFDSARGAAERLVDELDRVTQRPRTVGEQAAPPPPTSPAEAYLVALHAWGYPHLVGRRFALTDSITTLGRAADSGIALFSEASSRQHCQVERTSEGYQLVDVGSTNGTFVNERAKPIQRHVLCDGDRFLAGNMIFVFLRQPELEAKCEAALDFAAEHDAVTRVLQGPGWIQRLEREVLSARGAERPLTVMLLEVDGFARLNVQHGHLGNSLLPIRVATALRARVPETAPVGRMASHQFAAALPGVDITHALEVAERIRSDIANEPVMLDGEAVNLTVSVGVVPLYQHTDTDTLLEDAQQAVRRAVAAGQNTVRGPT